MAAVGGPLALLAVVGVLLMVVAADGLASGGSAGGGASGGVTGLRAILPGPGGITVTFVKSSVVLPSGSALPAGLDFRRLLRLRKALTRSVVAYSAARLTRQGPRVTVRVALFLVDRRSGTRTTSVVGDSSPVPEENGVLVADVLWNALSLGLGSRELERRRNEEHDRVWEANFLKQRQALGEKERVDRALRDLFTENGGPSSPPVPIEDDMTQLLRGRYDDGHVFGWKAGGVGSPSSVPVLRDLAKAPQIASEQELAALIADIQRQIGAGSAPPPPPPGKLARYSFNGLGISYQGTVGGGVQQTGKVSGVSGSVCGDPLNSTWALKGTLTISQPGQPDLIRPITGPYNASIPTLPPLMQAGFAAGASMTVRVKYNPGAKPTMEILGEPVGAITNIAYDAQRVPVTVTPAASC